MSFLLDNYEVKINKQIQKKLYILLRTVSNSLKQRRKSKINLCTWRHLVVTTCPWVDPATVKDEIHLVIYIYINERLGIYFKKDSLQNISQ